MWRVCISSKIKHPGGSARFVLQTKGRPSPNAHITGLFTFVKKHPYRLNKKKILRSSKQFDLFFPQLFQLKTISQIVEEKSLSWFVLVWSVLWVWRWSTLLSSKPRWVHRTSFLYHSMQVQSLRYNSGQCRYWWCSQVSLPLFDYQVDRPNKTLQSSERWNNCVEHINNTVHLNTLYFVNKITALKSFLKPSQLPGEYTAQLLPFRRIGLIKHNNQLCPHRYPFYPGWREAIMVKCLAQGHKHHGRSQDLNSHSDDSAIGTQIRCAKPLGHDTPPDILQV